jgi:beta-glucosidase
MSHLVFLKGFLWGASTAAYPIEGSWNKDGNGRGVWDRLIHRKYIVRNGEMGDDTCDHFRRMPKEILWMKEIGLESCRFSMVWHRPHRRQEYVAHPEAQRAGAGMG